MSESAVEWNQVGAGDVQAAMDECDRLGSREFLARYRFGRAHDATLWRAGEEYDARALMGLAYLSTTGTAVPADEFATGGEDGAVRQLKVLGFDVIIDDSQTPAPPKARKTAAAPRRAASPRAAAVKAAPKAPAAPKRLVMKGRDSLVLPESKICDTCFMAIPATGLCDNCD